MLDLTGYKLTFGDEFNTRSISQTGAGTTWADIRSQWRFDAHSDIGFGHSSFVDPSSGYDPFKVEGGALSITAVPDRTASGYEGSWESGLITTQGNFSQKYGYFEMRADLSDAKGGWDAFWLLPNTPAANPNKLPGWQELDVVEHYGVYNQGTYRWIHTTDAEPNEDRNTDLQVFSNNPTQVVGYHTYGMDWQKDKISFYFDGQFMGSQATPSDMHGPMYLLANLATQSDADQAGVPMTMKIDYIRAYSKEPGAVAVTQGVVSAPDGQDTGLYGATTAGTPNTPPSANPIPSPPVPSSPVPSSPVPTLATTSIGSGSDKLILKISEDAYKGDAQFTVSVDGKQIGGTLTAHASHAAKQSDTITVSGDWAAGDHRVSINFLNDAYDGTESTDRNLYVDSATYNGAAVAGSQFTMLGAGARTFTVQDTGPVPAPTFPVPSSPVPSSPVPTLATTSIGSGSDKLILKISEDAYKGDAQFTVSVDGKQIGGTLTAHASHAAKQSDTITVSGDWAAGDHRVSINFLNDAYDGTESTDRNLYVDSATYNGAAVAGSQFTMLGAGARTFTVQDTGPVPAPTFPVPSSPVPSSPVPTLATTSIGSGSDKLILKISEDAYKGDAQFTVSVDGKQIGGTLTAHASHAAKQSDTITVSGDWAAGDHRVSINFLNDAYDGTESTDRNLYVDSATYNGAAVAGSQFTMLGAGAHAFTLHDYGLL